MSMLTNCKLITSILPKGKALEVVRLLHEEKAIHSVNVASGRGVVGSVGHDVWSEVDILTVVVEAARAEEIFEFIYFRADMDRVHGGLIYQDRLTKATSFALPDLPGSE